MKQDMTFQALSSPLSQRLGPEAKWLLRSGNPRNYVLAVVRMNAAASGERIKEWVIAAGGRVRASLPTQRVLGVEMALSSLDDLARLDGVVSVEIDTQLQPS